MVFFRADLDFSNYRLFVSRCHEGAWGRPSPAPFAAPAPASESDPAFAPDGRRLYFISDGRGLRHLVGQADRLLGGGCVAISCPLPRTGRPAPRQSA